MDFSKINTRKDADAGSWMHLRHPQLGHLLYSGEGADADGRLTDVNAPHEACELLIRGMDSSYVRERVRKREARKLRNDGNAEEDALALAVDLVMDARGIWRSVDPPARLKVDEEGIRWLYGLAEDFAVQAVQYARDSVNYFGAASTA